MGPPTLTDIFNLTSSTVTLVTDEELRDMIREENKAMTDIMETLKGFNSREKKRIFEYLISLLLIDKKHLSG